MKLMEDSNGDKSLTAGLLKITFTIALIKILLAGLKIKGIEFGDFSAADFGTMMAPMITLYWARRKAQIGPNKEKNSVK